MPLQEVVHQQRDVVAAAIQGRQIDRDDVQPVVEVGAEAALGHLLLEIAVGRGDHPQVDLDRLARTHRIDLALLQHPQQLDLDGVGRLAYLVEEDGAALGLPAETVMIAVGAGERSLDVTEELALEQGLGNRAAVDGHEGPAVPFAAVVDRTRDELLAGAAGPGDQHGGRGGGDLVDHLEDGLHARALADDPALGRRPPQLALELHVLAGRPPQRHGVAHDRADLVVLGMLLQIGIGAQIHRVDRRLLAGVGGQDHHRRLGVDGLDPLQQLDPVHLGHLDVGQHDIVGVALHQAQRLDARTRGIDRVALLLQEDRKVLAHRFFVVDNQNPVPGHSALLEM